MWGFAISTHDMNRHSMQEFLTAHVAAFHGACDHHQASLYIGLGRVSPTPVVKRHRVVTWSRGHTRIPVDYLLLRQIVKANMGI